ncbi:hypothetical protein AVEN_215810-1 [Araneus ventricosus]|uniref:Uncharacterized protein n=1 Tax=Araneus ventricosus TaxID=182803 RepID=A0A4Y2KZ51_ARAVE|nr:hypothetical protein AVEN_215810-1 [Araneus ventricosus]
MAKKSLMPKITEAEDIRRKELKYGVNEKKYYDRHHRVKDLKELEPRQDVWITDQISFKRINTKYAAPRSYLVETPRGIIRRNRFHLRPSSGQLEYGQNDTTRKQALDNKLSLKAKRTSVKNFCTYTKDPYGIPYKAVVKDNLPSPPSKPVQDYGSAGIRENKSDIKSYSPVTLLPTLGKILEKLLLERPNNHFRKNNLQHPNQYGFRTNRSAEDAIPDLLDKINLAENSNQHALMIPWKSKRHFTTRNTPQQKKPREPGVL